ncbi:MAG: hydrogenase formation protein HypD [Desulfomonilia bacterium]|jgi:hydrogenase expression/formation protein HypD
MRFIDEYRDPEVASGLRSVLNARALSIPRRITIMEVCGSHTYAIGRHGIRAMLPKDVRLVSGPGCPVCVTSVEDIDRALFLAGLPGVIFATFGDMIRVPGTGGRSLQMIRAGGADVRVVFSASECINLAVRHPDRQVVFMGIGFETTSPTVASMVKACSVRGIENVSVFSVHKLIPPAIDVLLGDEELAIDGFLCPGHVSTILGTKAYAGIPSRGCAAVITGFEPVDILQGICQILNQIIEGRYSVEIQYTRGVKPEGNPRAQALLEEVFTPVDARWRGLGTIPASGLGFSDKYLDFDARKRFEIPEIHSEDAPGCRCGEILKGRISPLECPLFRTMCTPENPVGPCMVSSEGTCAAYHACNVT